MGLFRSFKSKPKSGERSDTSALLSCESHDCPTLEPHKPGPYYHNGKPLETEHEMWGESNPSPAIWKALDKYNKGRANAAEIHAVVTFQEIHSQEWLMG